jgi:hypothetical protein
LLGVTIGVVCGAAVGVAVRVVAEVGTFAADGLPVVGAPISKPIKLASAEREGCTWLCGRAFLAIGGATGVWLRLCGWRAFVGGSANGCGGLCIAAGAVGGV